MHSNVNTQPSVNQPDSDIRAISFALLVSIVMHFSIMRALPWLETAKTKPPLTIIAELQTLAPPPPPPSVESKPVEPLSKPEVVKVTQQPKSQPKPQAVATPVLAAQHTEQVSNYTVPDNPKPAAMPSEPATPVAPATPEHAAAESASATDKNMVSSSTSTTTWDESDVWDEYGRDLQRLCERYKKYPEIARRRGWQGLAKVSVRFNAEGKLLSVSIQTSSGKNALDEQALEMVKKSLNDLPVPAKFKGREFKLSIPIDFKLE